MRSVRLRSSPGVLRAAQQEHADDGGFAAGEVEDLLQVVLEFGHAAVGAADGAGEMVVFESVQGLADFGFVELHNWLSIVLLLQALTQCIERERVVLRRRDLFFDQRAQDAGFDGIQQDCHKQLLSSLRHAVAGGCEWAVVTGKEKSVDRLGRCA